MFEKSNAMKQLVITKTFTDRNTESLNKYLQEIAKEDLITTDEEIAAAPADVDGKTEMDAMIAYLQALGHARSGR